jgi:assimilatory nitrate reductase catalytic subunit
VADVPVDPLRIIERFGPHLSAMTAVRRSTSVEPDRLVKTHCCFCGQQCGIQLKVLDNEVIGFEPWEDFPFNRGMLCPKGVKRYLQGSHPDRLTTALRRDTSSPSGFSSMPYMEAVQRVAAEIGRIQETYGAGAVGVLGGASLTTEKTYLLGKFARVCLKTPFIDYNGRLCMVSAGAANKKAFGIDRTTNPWSDMVGTEVIWVAGSNVAECSPITTNYLWQAREQGAKIIMQDPRITPAARTCDLYLPVKPGRDAALFAGVLQVMIERDWLDHAFIDAHTVGFEQVAEYCREWTLPRTAEVTGVPQRALMQAAEWWGTAKTSFLFHARGIEHHSNGVQNSLGTINLVLATGRIGKPKSGYGTIVGQANGQGGREHGALLGEQALRVEHVLALRATDREQLLADAQVLLRLPDRRRRRVERGQPLLGAAQGRAQRLFEGAELRLELDLVLVDGELRGADAFLALGVGAEIPAHADEARADLVRLEQVRGRVVHRAGELGLGVPQGQVAVGQVMGEEPVAVDPDGVGVVVGGAESGSQ